MRGARKRPPAARAANARLAEAATLIAEDYLRFMSSDWEDQEAVRAFAARQAAAKAALAHLELLQKLAGDPEGARDSIAQVRQLLVQQAREAVSEESREPDE